MPNFKESRDQLQNLRDREKRDKHALFLAKQQLKRLEEREKQLQRVFNPNKKAHVGRQQQLDRQRRSIENNISKWTSALADTEGELLDWVGTFELFIDPRQNVGSLNDRTPFLLFPVRIETRFKKVAIPGATEVDQLWVRIYPDECMVDNFEEALSEMELKNGRDFWVNRYRAGGIEADDRAAWRSLVAAHGTGRAAYIFENYPLPEEPNIPQKVNRQDVFLIIASEVLPDAATQDALSQYWAAVWQADTDQTALQSAFNDLATSVGAAQAEALIQQYIPENLEEQVIKPFTKTDVTVATHWLQIPNAELVEAKQYSWSEPPRSYVMPDRFVLRLKSGTQWTEHIGNTIPQPLILGPDPSAEEEDLLQKEEGDLKVPDDMSWMVDFEKAIEKGMGFKINLNATQAIRGFEAIHVLGLRLSADMDKSQELLETLFAHHHYSTKGMEIIQQGTPTNNTETNDSGFSYLDDADRSYDRYILKQDILELKDEDTDKQDGQWLAESLGIDESSIAEMAHANGSDQCVARAMNTALWPATLGYCMHSMMGEVFSNDDHHSTRSFFTKYVQGRGTIPPIRIGEQPYGILPTTAWSKMQWINDLIKIRDIETFDHNDWPKYLKELYDVLKQIDEDWEPLLEKVSYVGKKGSDLDAQQMLLDIVGLHPSSAEFHQRYAMSFEQVFNQFQMLGLGGLLIGLLITGSYVKSGTDLLKKFGYDSDLDDNEVPEILQKFFLGRQIALNDQLVDDRPVSETDPIRSYTEDDKNYITWLKEAAASDFEKIRKQTGFTDNKKPTSLLYLLLRHGLQLGYWDTGLKLYEAVGDEILSGDQLRQARREPKFLHVQDAKQEAVGISKYDLLYREAPLITDSDTLTVAQHIPAILQFNPITRDLKETIDALAHLENINTADLNRALQEHLDTCTYRLDAWKQGLIHYQLQQMRNFRTFSNDDTGNVIDHSKGIYLGAYGWLENVRPENKFLEPANLSPELEAIFKPNEAPQLMEDSTNQGFIHAPSLNHAVTASILRNGYLSNATPEEPGLLGVNLSSERVRQAMLIIEGIRQGQSLGALLGYKFERDLHDNHQLAETDEFIYDLRKVFPLVADNLEPTKSDTDTPIKAVEARNVIDGLKLIEHVEETREFSYPFGKANLPTANAAQRNKINAALQRIRNINDAVADLGIAESVHQAALGNIERAAASLEAFGQGGLPPIPQVVQTPRSGKTLTHRIGLHLDPNADLTTSPWPMSAMNARAQAEPALNQWLSTVLPSPDNIVVHIHRADTDITTPITVAQMGWQPVDLFYLLRLEEEQQMSEIDDRILTHYLQAEVSEPRPDVDVTIQYRRAGNVGQVSLFELSPMLDHLRKLVLSGRPLIPTDLSLANEAAQRDDLQMNLNINRLDTPNTAIPTLKSDVEAYFVALNSLMDDVESNQALIISDTENRLNNFLQLAARAGQYQQINSGRSFAFAWKNQFFNSILTKTEELTNKWQDQLDKFDTGMTEYLALDPATPDNERYKALHRLELLVATTFSPTDGETPVSIVANANAKRSAFNNKRNDLINDILNSTTTSAVDLYNTLQGHLPLEAFTAEVFTLEEQTQQLIAFNQDLLNRSEALLKALTKTEAALGLAMVQHSNASSANGQIEAIQEAGKKLFGDDFLIIPQFSLAENQSDEWSKLTPTNDLLSHATSITPFPVDEWLYGLARVRKKMKHWEQLSHLTEGFTGLEPILTPHQLPFVENDNWLGLEFPETYNLETDKLLYTAHHSVPFNPDQVQCGLLLDEWTEVIPEKEETTGITFHYDTPNSEPPQTMLLVTPTRHRGGWQWTDLTDTLEETLEMAKKRAIEPDHVDDTSYARFLPAAIMAVTLYPITVSLNLALVNGVEAKLDSN